MTVLAVMTTDIALRLGRKKIGIKYAKMLKQLSGDFPGGPVVKNLPANAGDVGWIPECMTLSI